MTGLRSGVLHNDRQNHKLGDANFAMSTTYCNDHDWGDNASYDLDNLFNPHDEYDNACNTIERGVWNSVNFACMWFVWKICYVIAILLKQ